MKLSKQDVENIAEISQVFLTEEEKEEQVVEINKLLGAMDILKEVDITDVEPLTHVFPNSNVLREDNVGETLSEEETFRNAPEVEERMFKVPKIV